MADNNTANVSTGKGVKGGYFFSAPATEENLNALRNGEHKDLTKKVNEILDDVNNIGYISEDGWKVSESRNIDKQKDVNGEVVNSSLSSREETVAATLLEKKKDTMAEMYGQDNVTDEDGIIEALHTGDDSETRIYFAELVLKNGRRWRYIFPLGQVGDIGDEQIAANSLVGREVTINGQTFNYKDKTCTSIEVLESTETKKAGSEPTGNEPQDEG